MNKRKIYYIGFGIMESLFCLLFGFIVLVITSYINSDLIWLFIISAFALPCAINIIVLFENRNEHAGVPFLSVLSAITIFFIFYFLKIYEIVGDYAYSLEHKSGWINFNWDDFILTAYTGICIFLLLIACLINLSIKYFKRKKLKI